MPTKCLERRPRGAICHVDLAISCSAAHQQAGLVAHVLDKAHVPNSSIVHRQFNFLACLHKALASVQSFDMEFFLLAQLPSMLQVSALNRMSLTVLSLLPVAIRSPAGLQAKQ